MRLGLLAGEASGDRLGSGLMHELSRQVDQDDSPVQKIEFVGVGGPRMLEAGLVPLADMSELAVNGFRDPLLRLPQLFRLLKRLTRELGSGAVDGFVGIDFNVFNFLLEARLKRRGVPTAHYVSPSVYAWRRGRTKKVAKSADLILCLYPFEPQFYADTPVRAEYIGHPLADEIDAQAGSAVAQRAARETLGLDADRTVLAVLPGSRRGEVKLMLAPFMEAAERFVATQDAQVVIPCLRPELHDLVVQFVGENSSITPCLYNGDARLALTACDIALVKSGTSTLETMLLHRPMVVSYRVGGVTYQILKRMVRSPYVALPNILAGRMWVPELLQDEATGPELARALDAELSKARNNADYLGEFEALHEDLRQGADASAASAVLALLTRNTVSGAS